MPVKLPIPKIIKPLYIRNPNHNRIKNHEVIPNFEIGFMM